MVGDTLRTEREKRNLTIQDIERETSINKRYLEALEKGDYDSMPSDVYIKGFIRNYSKFLEIDGNALLAEFAAERGAEPPQVQPVDKQEEKKEKPLNINDLSSKRDNINIKVRKTKSSDGNSGKAFSSGDDFRNRVSNGSGYGKKIMIGLVALVVVFLGGVYIAFSDDDSAPPATQNTTQVPEAKKDDTKPEPKKEAPAAADELKLEVVLTDRCWMQVLVDGKVAFEGTAESGISMDWTAKKDVKVIAGNAGAVEVIINGKSQGKLGNIGQVVERQFTKETAADSKQSSSDNKSAGENAATVTSSESSTRSQAASHSEDYRASSHEQNYQEPASQQAEAEQEPVAEPVSEGQEQNSTPAEEPAPTPGNDVVKTAQ